MSDECFFVVNPMAAGGRLKRAWPGLEERLREALGGRLAVGYTRGPGDASRIAAEAARAGHTLVVSVGGDGTHNEVVNGLVEDDRPVNPETSLGILPFGTGGDFKKVLGPSYDVEAAIRALRDGHDGPLDIGRVDYLDDGGAERSRYFLNIGGFGIGGLVDLRVNQSKKWLGGALGGTLSFAIASLRAMKEYSHPPAELQVDDGPWISSPIFHVAVANGQYFGGGMHIAPFARLDDGLFDVIVMKEPPKIEGLLRSLDIYLGRHIANPWVMSLRGRCVRARYPTRKDKKKPTPLHLEIDGETPGTLPASFHMLAGALKLRQS